MVSAGEAESADNGAASHHSMELLAPFYADVVGDVRSHTINLPITFHRTARDWIKVVFSSLPNMEKDVACINNDSVCSCEFVRLIDALLLLVERSVLRIKAKYVVVMKSSANNNKPLATIQVSARVHENVPTSASLQEFDFVLTHLQASLLSIVTLNRHKRLEMQALAVQDAKRSSCHVVGCRLHPLEELKMHLKSRKLHLPDVFHSLLTPIEADQMEIREDPTYLDRMERPWRQIVITDLPMTALQQIVSMMNARDLASLSSTCSIFQHLSYEVVPGLKLMLFQHQQKALKWMLYRESTSVTKILPHPFMFPPIRGNSSSNHAIDLIDRRILKNSTHMAQDARGGLFCDEPGLGKTITMLALILRTKSQTTNPLNATAHSNRRTSVGHLRSSESRGRDIRTDQLVGSSASLIIVPNPLIGHWKYQIEAHVTPGTLKVFVDEDQYLPSSRELARYDIVISTFGRLAEQWRKNRPGSALEERMPERYGFEGPQRYIDGQLRGDVSSLLRVHWVRIVVDEGHKLGGTSVNSQMRMARLICADKRWVMTGTPTPNTLQSADLRHMHGLLVFLRNVPYGNPDAKAWVKSIARPFEQNQPIAFFRLQHLLSRIMIRHTKDSIRETLPEPIRRTVLIDPTPTEYGHYNAIAAAVRANLVLTNMDPKTPGMLHPDSLLNPINRKSADQVVKNLRAASCGGSMAKIVLSASAFTETVNLLHQQNIGGDMMTDVLDYLRRSQTSELSTACSCCRRQLQLLMIVPCGHLCCADCLEDQIEKTGPVCSVCNTVYDREVFQTLQPGFEFELEDEIITNDGGEAVQNHHLQDRGHGRNHPRQRPNITTRRAIDYNRDFQPILDSKALYAVTRIKELKEEFARGNLQSTNHVSRQPQRHVKAIIYSQFREHIWRTKVAFAQQGVPTADFIVLTKPKERMKNLARFRTDPSMNVLLLTDIGSHGLDLSFVTHIFLMEEIWDKSLEQQVISRAHRMGTNQSVVVEQLVMRGTVEGLMLKMNETSQYDLVDEPRQENVSTSDRLGSPTGHHLSNGSLFNGVGKPRKRHRTKEQRHKESKSNKKSRIQQQLHYILNNLRLLGEEVVAEPGEVRYIVVDDNDGVIQRGIREMPNFREVGSTVASTHSFSSNAFRNRNRESPTASTNAVLNSLPAPSMPTTRDPPEIIIIDDDTSDNGLPNSVNARKVKSALVLKKRNMRIIDDDDSTADEDELTNTVENARQILARAAQLFKEERVSTPSRPQPKKRKVVTFSLLSSDDAEESD